MRYVARAANFAGLLAWRMKLALSCGPLRGLPATTPGFFRVALTGSVHSGPYWAGQTIRRSDLRSLDSAVQSRVGDGFLAGAPMERLASATR
jgi:hypothetical protein